MNVHDLPSLDEHVRTIQDIGVARFVGRIHAGFVPSHAGYAAIEAFVSHERERPFLSKVVHTVLGRPESFDSGSGNR